MHPLLISDPLEQSVPLHCKTISIGITSLTRGIRDLRRMVRYAVSTERPRCYRHIRTNDITVE